jgi:hypothetical protein
MTTLVLLACLGLNNGDFCLFGTRPDSPKVIVSTPKNPAPEAIKTTTVRIATPSPQIVIQRQYYATQGSCPNGQCSIQYAPQIQRGYYLAPSYGGCANGSCPR